LKGTLLQNGRSNASDDYRRIFPLAKKVSSEFSTIFTHVKKLFLTRQELAFTLNTMFSVIRGPVKTPFVRRAEMATAL
jgi:hypothetical protein